MERMNRKIIIIDDDPTSNYISEFILSSMYSDVDIVSFINPLEALDRLPAMDLASDSIILLDLNMPEMNGYEFVDSLEAKEVDCKIVILTCSKNLMDKEYSKKYEQIKGFISKPLTQDNIDVFTELNKK
jgi:CheY-like chemotaxis protein